MKKILTYQVIKVRSQSKFLLIYSMLVLILNKWQREKLSYEKNLFTDVSSAGDLPEK